MPNHVDDVLLHAMDDSELSRVRTEFNQLRILPIVAPHPVQPNGKFSGHGHFGNSFFPAHHQVHIPTSPICIAPCGCLCCFHQQKAQQCIALLANVSQPAWVTEFTVWRNKYSVLKNPTDGTNGMSW